MQQVAEPTQQCAAAGHGDTAVIQVTCQLRRAVIQGLADSAHDDIELILQRFANLFGAHGYGLGQTGSAVAALHLHLQLLLQRVGRAYADFDFFRRAGAYQQVVGGQHVAGDGFVQSIAAALFGLAVHDAGQGNNGYFRGATADVNNHAANGFCHRKPHADSGGHGFLNELNPDGARFVSGFFDGMALHLGNAGRVSDEDTRPAETTALAGAFDKVAQHVVRHLEVGDNAFLERTDSHHAAGGTPHHALGFLAHGLHLVTLHGNNGRLAQHNALVLNVDQGVGCAQVDPDIVREKTGDFLKNLHM